jgi:hypothetical protein
MSDLLCQDRRMKNRIENPGDGRFEEILATFGEAELIRAGGVIHLRGGSMADRMEALEWLSMFMPEAAVCVER